MPNGDLDMWLHNKSGNLTSSGRSLDLLQRLNLVMDVAFALDYLHNQCETPVVHCDLKPCNVLLDDDLTARVGDFGLARLLYQENSNHSQQQSSSMGLKGTLGYAAPEYGMGGQISTHGDVYSYGILLLELFTGRRPTDELFKDGLNLHEYVKGALSEVSKIVDPLLLFAKEEEQDYQGEIKEKRKNYKSLEKESKCLAALLEVGLSCSFELPKERKDMKNVVRELNMIKNAFVQKREI